MMGLGLVHDASCVIVNHDTCFIESDCWPFTQKPDLVIWAGTRPNVLLISNEHLTGAKLYYTMIYVGLLLHDRNI